MYETVFFFFCGKLLNTFFSLILPPADFNRSDMTRLVQRKVGNPFISAADRDECEG